MSWNVICGCISMQNLKDWFHMIVLLKEKLHNPETQQIVQLRFQDRENIFEFLCMCTLAEHSPSTDRTLLILYFFLLCRLNFHKMTKDGSTTKNFFICRHPHFFLSWILKKVHCCIHLVKYYLSNKFTSIALL